MSRHTAALFLVVFSLNCVGQSTASVSPVPELAFDVASVRLADPAGSNAVQTSPGSLTIRHTVLLGCIMYAYQFQHPSQVIGPDWLRDVRLDIVAKAATPAGDQALALMLRKLLEERMGVKAHFEKREVPVLALTPAKGGPRFLESTTEGPPARVQDTQAVVFQRLSMDEFAALWSKMFGRQIVDATGLKLRYDFRIDLALLNAVNPQDEAADVDAAMIAMQDQLGLKIESRRQIVDFLVIDHAEKTPAGN